MQLFVEPIKSSNELALSNYSKFSVSTLKDKGVSILPLVTSIKQLTDEPVYKAIIPKGTQLHDSKKSVGQKVLSFSGTNGKIGNGTLMPVPVDPLTIAISTALMNINQKLDAIQETQEEIFDYLKDKDQARLIGNLNTLVDIQDNYGFNWDNDMYKKNKHILVQEIRRESEHNVIYYREYIKKLFKKKKGFSSVSQNQKLVDKLSINFKDYQSSLYLLSFSTLLETLLLENFESAFLSSVAQKLKDYAYDYRMLYSNSFNEIKLLVENSMEVKIMRTLSNSNRQVGKTLGKIPLIKDRKVDESLIMGSEKTEKKIADGIKTSLDSLVKHQNSLTLPFIESIQSLEKAYSKDIEIIVDGDFLYLG